MFRRSQATGIWLLLRMFDEVCRHIWAYMEAFETLEVCLLDTEPDFSRHPSLLQAVLGNRLW